MPCAMTETQDHGLFIYERDTQKKKVSACMSVTVCIYTALYTQYQHQAKSDGIQAYQSTSFQGRQQMHLST